MVRFPVIKDAPGGLLWVFFLFVCVVFFFFYLKELKYFMNLLILNNIPAKDNQRNLNTTNY